MRAILILCLSLVFAPPAFAKKNVQNVSEPAAVSINAVRAKHGQMALSPSEKLTRAAKVHAEDMIRKGFFSHTGSDGSTIGTRAAAQGYGYCVIAENIAKGHLDVKDVLTAWMKSKGHRRNILNAEVTEFALVRGQGDVWVMVLGRPGC